MMDWITKLKIGDSIYCAYAWDVHDGFPQKVAKIGRIYLTLHNGIRVDKRNGKCTKNARQKSYFCGKAYLDNAAYVAEIQDNCRRDRLAKIIRQKLSNYRINHLPADDMQKIVDVLESVLPEPPEDE